MTNEIDTDSLHLCWSSAPWDTVATGYPVWQLNAIELKGPGAGDDMRLFENARDGAGVGMISCRLGHNQLQVSMFLEDHGFRFVEMIFLPELELTPDHLSGLPAPSLTVTRAGEKELPLLIDMAGSVFSNERFHVDPRLGADMGNKRYQTWIRNSLTHPTQRLYALQDNSAIVSFFVTEMLSDDTCYWHLNAVSHKYQGLGYGLRSWSTMVHTSSDEGARMVRTCIVARNYRVLNLYARLGFRFPPPLMTFHWVKAG